MFDQPLLNGQKATLVLSTSRFFVADDHVSFNLINDRMPIDVGVGQTNLRAQLRQYHHMEKDILSRRFHLLSWRIAG